MGVLNPARDKNEVKVPGGWGLERGGGRDIFLPRLVQKFARRVRALTS